MTCTSRIVPDELQTALCTIIPHEDSACNEIVPLLLLGEEPLAQLLTPPATLGTMYIYNAYGRWQLKEKT